MLWFGDPSELGRKAAGMFAPRRKSSAMRELPRADRRRSVCPQMLSLAMNRSFPVDVGDSDDIEV